MGQLPHEITWANTNKDHVLQDEKRSTTICLRGGGLLVAVAELGGWPGGLCPTLGF
jgi:hypothetical protein